MEAFLVSVVAITIGEIGDKTQLLALLLAARFKRPLPIVLGIFVATISNHILAALLGHWVATHLSADFLRWALGVSFLAIAAWTLKPDKMEESKIDYGKYGVFTITVITFFLAEIGDKTQIATMALAAKYDDIYMVLAGSTLGIMIADVPAVFLGKVASPNFPFKWIRWGAAAIFAVLGAAVLLGFGGGLI
ncbi:TMEM165/GDT1 family protein [Solimicrobium silvestre]|uniref:GDT1 family protein n=1 Tax=Solimicrobium silvestre TaxID=2099400 RepID=A0A2S9GSE5_9BURK|nr:TMEM165/GDT1 family protein [Solimicrobium silvestre]PRC90630.1 putative membrane protein [Solimicrobium silvestre]